jgi:2-keto-3-deoxy-L-rhamnonate aldolase RhmA
MSNPFKDDIRKGGMIRAAWVELGVPDIGEILVRHGWKTIVIDGEHGRGELEDWLHVARAIEAAGGTVVLRLPDGNDTTIKQALDRGFRNFIVPLVNSAEDARRIVSAFYYPSRGHRGYAAPIVRGSDWGARTQYALEDSFDDLVLMIQCEHVEAVANLEDIMAVDGIDVIFIGPNDLGASAGHLEELDAPPVLALLDQIEEIAHRYEKPLATVRSAGRDWHDLEARGFKVVVGINDVSLLIDGARTELAKALQMDVKNVKPY